MPYNRQIPDAPIAPSMLPRVAAADLTSQDVLVLTQPGNNPGQKNKSLELGALFDSQVFTERLAYHNQHGAIPVNYIHDIQSGSLSIPGYISSRNFSTAKTVYRMEGVRPGEICLLDLMVRNATTSDVGGLYIYVDTTFDDGYAPTHSYLYHVPATYRSGKLGGWSISNVLEHDDIYTNPRFLRRPILEPDTPSPCNRTIEIRALAESDGQAMSWAMELHARFVWADYSTRAVLVPDT